MSIKIEDGKGGGYQAEVTKDNKLRVNGVQKRLIEEGAATGDVYFLASGFEFITNTSAEVAFAYLKNTSTTRDLRIDDIRVSNNQADARWRLYASPTTVSANVTATPVNSNRQKSGTPLKAQFLTYATAATGFTGGTIMSQLTNPAAPASLDTLDTIVLGENDDVLLTLQCATSVVAATTWVVNVVDRE